MRGKFWGAVQLGRLLQQHLRPEGSLLLFTGVAAYRPAAGLGMVAAPNLMLQSMVETLTLEHRPRRVNAISPGVVDSGTWSHLTPEARQALFDDVARSLPVGRVGQVQDLVHAALAVMENGFISGTVVHVDGGARLV
jgi:NAD(P)-dependent dehydrogenase (short-subunit alcohol dehydrogenase family)